MATQFYSTILGDAQALLPLRDRISHFRDQSDIGQAETAMLRVKNMMETMASKLNESTRINRIPWGFRL